jgi:hypothetical protein
MKNVGDSNGRGGGGRGGGDDDGTDLSAGPDDETVVIVGDAYIRASFIRLSERLRRVADRYERVGALGGEAESEQEALIGLEELEDEMSELAIQATGSQRAVGRYRRERAAAFQRTQEPKETET